MGRWAVMVVWSDGEREYLKAGKSPDGPIAIFTAKSRAEKQAEFMRIGMDDVLSVSVVDVETGEIEDEVTDRGSFPEVAPRVPAAAARRQR